MRRRALKKSTISIFLVGVVLFFVEEPVWAQEGSPPTVDIYPVGTSAEQDPNGGEWFITTASPGQTKTLQARLTNPASVPQRVNLYLADLVYGEDGSPSIPDPPYQEVGTWGSFDRPTVTIGPEERLVESFSITVPEGMDPGDWVGMVVVEHAPIGASDESGLNIVRRVATKVYVTVPGSAPQDFIIQRIEIEKDSFLFPREATVRIWLQNTGRIRLQPTVLVNGKEASGPTLLMTRSQEPYLVNAPIPFWGGPVGLKIEATTRTSNELTGPVRQARASTFAVPFHLLFLVALATGLFFGGRWVWRKRGSKYDALQSDIRRLERLLSGVAAGQQGAQDSLPDGRDPETAIRSAIKQARRAGDEDTVRRLEAKLDEVRGTPPEEVLAGGAADDANPAVAAILRDIADAPPKRQGALIQAARAYGIKELRKHEATIDELPDEVRVRLLARKSPAKPSSGEKGRPAKRKK